MLDLLAGFGFGKRHIEGNPGNDGLPCFIFREPASLDRAPEIDDFFFGYRLEKILTSFSIQS